MNRSLDLLGLCSRDLRPRDQVREIAKTKSQDLNASDEESMMRVIEGTARSMGIEIED